jgi:hypothetical protein
MHVLSDKGFRRQRPPSGDTFVNASLHYEKLNVKRVHAIKMMINFLFELTDQKHHVSMLRNC